MIRIGIFGPVVLLAGCGVSPAVDGVPTIVAQHLLNAFCAAPGSGINVILTTEKQRQADRTICERTNPAVP